MDNLKENKMFNYELELPKEFGGEKIKFEDHSFFNDAIYTIISFNNGFGASIITKRTKGDKVEKNNSYHSMTTAQGSWDDETFELAVVKNDKGKFNHIEIQDFCKEDTNYETNGVWVYLTKQKLFEKMNLIKNLGLSIT